ncbi:MAG: hypothetical protein RMK16_01060 [Acidobacteriota bacterium]|nr:hypothetical protein [Acidobacteriota bacterium]
MTLRLIADYGAIGGKTGLKPSDEPNRQNALHHQDFGLIRLQSNPEDVCRSMTRKTLEEYVSDARWRRDFDDGAFSWASLKNFWCVKGRYLARKDEKTSTFNRVIGRPEPKTQAQQGDSWLAGRRARGGNNPQPAESKKVFSSKHPEAGRRTFGFVKPGMVDFGEIKNRLGQAWVGFQPDSEFKEGEAILRELLDQTSHRRTQP